MSGNTPNNGFEDLFDPSIASQERNQVIAEKNERNLIAEQYTSLIESMVNLSTPEELLEAKIVLGKLMNVLEKDEKNVLLSSSAKREGYLTAEKLKVVLHKVTLALFTLEQKLRAQYDTKDYVEKQTNLSNNKEFKKLKNCGTTIKLLLVNVDQYAPKVGENLVTPVETLPISDSHDIESYR